MNYYTNVLTALKWISVTVATIGKLRDFQRIIEYPQIISMADPGLQ
jgi:hypothetical protein